MRRFINFQIIKKIFLTGIASIFFQNGIAQEGSRKLLAKYINEVIDLDGELNESIWKNTPKSSDFWQYFPSDSITAKYQTTVQFVYDDDAI